MAAQLCKFVRDRKSRERGFTVIEIVIVAAIGVTAAAVAIPGYLAITRYLRLAGDARDLNATVAQAKMRGAQDFTHARVRANLTANTFVLEVWDKTANGNVGCWKTEGDPVSRCTSMTDSPVQSLSSGVTFGTAGVGSGGSNPFSTIAQGPTCTSGVAGGAAGTTYSGTACVEFNSRGIPVAANNSPALSDALYVTDLRTVYGITILSSGLIQVWATDASASAWKAR